MAKTGNSTNKAFRIGISIAFAVIAVIIIGWLLMRDNRETAPLSAAAASFDRTVNRTA